MLFEAAFPDRVSTSLDGLFVRVHHLWVMHLAEAITLWQEYVYFSV